MNHELFIKLMQNILHINVETFIRRKGSVESFCNRFCYNEELQPVFTNQALSTITNYTGEYIIYEVNDLFNNRIQILNINNRIYLFGPFSTSEPTEYRIQQILLAHKLPAAYSSSIKMYCGTFPVISSYRVSQTINSILRSMDMIVDDCPYALITNIDALPVKQREPYEKIFDFNTVNHRYELENRFLNMIEHGDIENVLIAYHEMAASGFNTNRNVNAIYSDPNVSLTMLRALARKAAERGGASVIEINDITQRAVQKMVFADSNEEKMESIKDMIVELTTAVRNHNLNQTKYSNAINKTIEYLSLNYSQNISLDYLAKRVSYSSPYLSKQFKKEVGITISQYIQQFRCNQAAEMLSASNTSISDISYYVGYEDNNYFVKIFKKFYQMTPSEYRKKHSR